MTSIITRTVRRMPPLNPLRAFEVAARHLNFTQAADELCVTQGAISRSVKALEDYLGEPLFKRTGYGLALTERSEALAQKLSDGFTRIGEAADEFRGVQASPVLTVRTSMSFLTGFLIPNLHDFQLKHPEIRVRLFAAPDSTEFTRETADVGICYGRGRRNDVESTLLFYDALRPLCSPALLDPAKRPYPIEELRRHVLLHEEMRQSDWPSWLAMAGCTELQPRDNLVFDECSIAFQAAMAGNGIVMAQHAYFQRELASGYLFEPFEPVLRRELGYYLVIPTNRRDAPRIRIFKRWLIDTLTKVGIADPAPISSLAATPRFALSNAARTAGTATMTKSRMVA
jgi:LysR family transcriptional regulator, glycine cleavage system transcriptional activator